MNGSQAKTYADFVLPPSVVSKVDLSRLVDEVEKIDNELTTASVRAGVGVNEPAAPTASKKLIDFMNQNQIRFGTGPERSLLIKQLRKLKDMAPVVHMTFAVEADPESLGRLAQWLRASLHPQTVVTVGVQPALIAGVHVRTPNHVHDMSLRAQMDNGHEVLVNDLGALRGAS